MDQYIHPENQKLLWNNINKVPHFNELPIHQKNELFKSVISLFYEKYKNNKITNDQLRQLNKDTISLLIQHLRTNISTNPIMNSHQMSNISYLTDGPNTTHIVKKDMAIIPGKQEPFESAFKNRLNEYELMSAKSKPSIEVDFTEKLDDEPISEVNMSSIIQKHLKERENEMTMAYLPSNIVPPPSLGTVNANQQSNIQTTVNISKESSNKKEIDNLYLQIEEIKQNIKKDMTEIKELLFQIRNEFIVKEDEKNTSIKENITVERLM
jgi:hypothetical protein